MVALHESVEVGAGGWWLGEGEVDQIGQSALEEDDALRVDLSDLLMDELVQREEVLVSAVEQQDLVLVDVSDPWLVDDLVSDHVLVGTELGGDVLPHVGEGVLDAVLVVVQVLEGLLDGVGPIVPNEGKLEAALQGWVAVLPEDDVGVEWGREWLSVDGPVWETLSAVELTDGVLVEVDEDLDAVLAGDLDDPLHVGDVGLVVGTSGRLDSRPVDGESDDCLSPFDEVLGIFFAEGEVEVEGVEVWGEVRGDLVGDVDSVEDSIESLGVLEELLWALDCEFGGGEGGEGQDGGQGEQVSARWYS